VTVVHPLRKQTKMGCHGFGILDKAVTLIEDAAIITHGQLVRRIRAAFFRNKLDKQQRHQHRDE
jgi:hypothetical protein